MTAHLGSNLVCTVFPIYPDVGENPLTVLIYIGLIWSVVLALMLVASLRKTTSD